MNILSRKFPTTHYIVKESSLSYLSITIFLRLGLSFRKKTVLFGLYVNTSKMSNTGYRTIIKLCTRKGLNETEITKELADVYGSSAPSYCIVAKWVAEFKDSTRAFEDAPQSGRPTTALTDESIRTVYKRS